MTHHSPPDLRLHFEPLVQPVIITAGTAASLAIAAGLLFNNPGIALTGMAAAALSLIALHPIHIRAAQITDPLQVR